MKYRAYEETLDSGLVRVALEGPGCSAAITPRVGMNLYSWIVDGREFFMPTQNVGAGGSGYGTPILFPTPNRMRDGMYTFDGQTRTVRNADGEKVLIHGLVMSAPYSYRFWADDRGAYCEGSIEFKEGAFWNAGYPYPCRLTVRYSFCEKGLLFDAKVENLGSAAMPFGLAIHPYFSKFGDDTRAEIEVPVQQHYDVTPDLLPTGKLHDVTPGDAFDLTKPRRLSDTDVDTVYRGMDSGKTSRVHYRALGKTITVNADDDFTHVVVYTPHHRPGFCIEPQTCSTDAINMTAKGFGDIVSLKTLAPGASWAGQIRIGIEG